MTLHPGQIFETEQREHMAAQDNLWRQQYEAAMGPEIEKIRFNSGRGMSRKRLEEIYGVAKVGMALGSAGG